MSLTETHTNSEIIIIGAGAAGLFCAAQLTQKGYKTQIIDNGNQIGRKILMSGGGRCNFTNLDINAENYLSENPHFCKSALSRYTQWHFIELINQYNIPYHQRNHGQLFCDHSAKVIIELLKRECQKGHYPVDFQLKTTVLSLHNDYNTFILTTSAGIFTAPKVIIASGGLSLPSLGTTSIGYKIAENFGLTIVPVRAGLVPLTLHKSELTHLSPLAGIAIPATVTTSSNRFTENLLFTHRGLSGPVILQISNYWKLGEPLSINLLPNQDLYAFLTAQKQQNESKQLKSALAVLLPKKLIDTLITLGIIPDISLKQLTHHQLDKLIGALTHWQIIPNNTEGYRTAEVTLGGVCTKQLSSKSMEVKQVPNLYFIGEVVDITGWLGGYNLQWAWSSAWACADSI